MSRHRSIAAAIAAVLIASPLVAQSTTANGIAQDPQAVAVAAAVATPAVTPSIEVVAAPSVAGSFAPTLSNAAVGVRVNAAVPANAPAPFQDSVGRNPAMMIVGAVALIAGSFIDGDAGTIIMIAGGGLGLYGLWQYLK